VDLLKQQREGICVLALSDPEYWRQRAEERRAFAADMKEENSKQMMLQIAEDFERLAKRIEERTKRPPLSN